MKSFTRRELSKLKKEIKLALETKNSYKSLIKIYYTSFEILLYFRTSGQNKLSKDDFDFWVSARDTAAFTAPEIEKEVLPLFAAVMEFEDSLIRARHMCFHPHGDPDREKKYYALLKQSIENKDHYKDLRQLAGIYLDLLSNEPEEEEYKLWRYYYDRLSDMTHSPKRGFAEEDAERVSFIEMLTISCKG